MDPKQSFIPVLEREFGKENIIVVKDAMGAQYISRWYKDWKSSTGQVRENSGDLYDRLITKVKAAIGNQKLATLTFIWMQGEADALGFYDANVYEDSLLGLYTQLRDDLHREDINWVIGRISDYDMHNAEYKRWTAIRDIQVKVAESDARFAWVDTDDLNDGGLHYSDAGYKTLGKRFAKSAIELIQQNNAVHEDDRK